MNLLPSGMVKSAGNGIALAAFLITVPHTPLTIPSPPSEARLTVAALPVQVASGFFAAPGTVKVQSGQTVETQNQRYAVGLNAIHDHRADVTLSYRNCTATYCVGSPRAPHRADLSLGESVRYAGYTVRLTSLTDTVATFSLRE